MLRVCRREEETFVEPPDREMSDVSGYVMYATDFDIFLKRTFQGLTVGHVASILGVPAEHVPKYLNGDWGPSKTMLERLRLKSVLAISLPATAQRSKRGSPRAS